MSHADTIVLQSISHDKDLIIQKFNALIADILTQFKANDYHIIVIEASKADMPEGERIDLIERRIQEQCKFLTVNSYLASERFKFYTPRILANFTVNEQLYLLAHIPDLYVLRADVEDPNPMFANLVYSTVRQMILQTPV